MRLLKLSVMEHQCFPTCQFLSARSHLASLAVTEPRQSGAAHTGRQITSVMSRFPPSLSVGFCMFKCMKTTFKTLTFVSEQKEVSSPALDLLR